MRAKNAVEFIYYFRFEVEAFSILIDTFCPSLFGFVMGRDLERFLHSILKFNILHLLLGVDVSALLCNCLLTSHVLMTDAEILGLCLTFPKSDRGQGHKGIFSLINGFESDCCKCHKAIYIYSLNSIGSHAAVSFEHKHANTVWVEINNNKIFYFA